MRLLSKRDRRSTVYIDNDGYIIKEQPKYLTDNEMWCLDKMKKYGCVPVAERVGIETIRMEYIADEPITSKSLFSFRVNAFLNLMRMEGIRHGDLTRPHILVRDNVLYVIDWGESRYWNDPRPDKRPEGDAYWFNKTIEEILSG